MSSIYRCQKAVILEKDHDVLDDPPQFIVECALDLDEVEEISETIDKDGALYKNRASVHFLNGQSVIVMVPFEKILAAWEEAINASVLLRRFG